VIVPVNLLAIVNIGLFQELGLKIEVQPVFELLSMLENIPLKIGLILVAVIGAPFIEELLFRGIFYPFLKAKFGYTPALLITSALFSAFHLHPSGALPLFGLGVAFTLVYEWRGNLFASMVAHSLFNGFTLLLLWNQGGLF